MVAASVTDLPYQRLAGYGDARLERLYHEEDLLHSAYAEERQAQEDLLGHARTGAASTTKAARPWHV